MVDQQGYENIAILATRPAKESATCKTTLQAYEQVFHQAPQADLLRIGIRNEADGYQAAQYFVTHQLSVDFIFANGDDVAAGARRYYLEHELSVPALMGQENQLSSRLLNMPTIDHHFCKVGQDAAQLAISGDTQQIKVHSEFLARK